MILSQITKITVKMRNFSDCVSYFITCDEGWVGFSESPSCYLFADRQRETFQDAQNICQSYGAQLVKIDTESEKVTKYFIVRKLKMTDFSLIRQNFLTSSIGEKFNEKAWVGLKFQNDAWQWILDNSTVDTNVMYFALR